jgi:hypothetical protein
MHIAALILGILGLILCWIPFVGWLGILLAVVALILSIVLLIKKDTGNKTFGVVGLVLGGIALIIGLVIQIPALLLTSEGIEMYEEHQESQALTPDKPFD